MCHISVHYRVSSDPVSKHILWDNQILLIIESYSSTSIKLISLPYFTELRFGRILIGVNYFIPDTRETGRTTNGMAKASTTIQMETFTQASGWMTQDMGRGNISTQMKIWPILECGGTGSGLVRKLVDSNAEKDAFVR